MGQVQGRCWPGAATSSILESQAPEHISEEGSGLETSNAKLHEVQLSLQLPPTCFLSPHKVQVSCSGINGEK